MATKKSPPNDTPPAPVEAPDLADTDGDAEALGTAETPASAGSTGHAFSKDSLLGEQTTAIEDALYSALRAVEEKATALRRLGERSAGRSDMLQADFESKATALEETAEVLRSILSREAA